MEEKWTHRAVGAGVGAIVMLFALPFGAGWYTAGGAQKQADEAVRDHLKTIGTYKTDLTFWRACGKLLEGKVEKTASK